MMKLQFTLLLLFSLTMIVFAQTRDTLYVWPRKWPAKWEQTQDPVQTDNTVGRLSDHRIIHNPGADCITNRRQALKWRER